MFLTKLRTAMAGFCVLTMIGSGLLGVARVAAEDPKQTTDGPPAAGSSRTAGLQPPTIMAKPPELGGEAWPMSLRDAIRIGLGNSEIILVISSGAAVQPIGGYEPAAPEARPDPARMDAGVAPIVIARRNPGAAPWRFKSELMAEVRSIEQQYWNVNVAYIQLRAASEAVALAREAVKREEARKGSGRGSDGDLAEARRRLEQFNLDLVTRTSDAITTERALRNLLGLPPVDNRRIVPVTPPTEGRLEPDWDSSRAAMLQEQPDILQARERVSAAERQVPSSGVIPPGEPIVPTDVVEERRAYLRQVIHHTTHSLARFFLEIDVNYKQFKMASRLRSAADEWLAAQRAEYEAGRIPADRFCDAVGQYTAAVGTEAQYKATYNISIVALEEAKGTLLESAKITVVEGSKGTSPASSRAVSTTGPVGEKNRPEPGRDGALSRASHEPIGPTSPDAAGPIPPPGPTPTGPGRTDARDAKSDAGKMYSFHLTIGSGPRPFQIRGSFTVAPAREKETTEAGTG